MKNGMKPGPHKIISRFRFSSFKRGTVNETIASCLGSRRGHYCKLKTDSLAVKLTELLKVEGISMFYLVEL